MHGWENTAEARMENTTETRMGGMDMSDKKMNAESLRGTVRVLLSAVCFSTGGVLIKSIPWSSVTIQGARSIFSALVVGCYMLLRRQNTQGLTFITPCDSRKQANELVYYWNESHKKNGVYLYNT